jgi:hypothetical protein
MWCRNITRDVLLCISNVEVRYRSGRRTWRVAPEDKPGFRRG